MIECIFTIDYEIYGNGEGSLKELVYEPAEKLKAIFEKWNARFVPFIEVAELEMIDSKATDPAIDLVKHQIRDFYREGFELGLHLHPQWYKAKYEDEIWILDYSEYNLCTLPRERIVQIVDRSIEYLREVLGVADFMPFSFRAGNWLFQPTRTAASVLAERGIKVDSSVFKGGLQHQKKLDYRRANRNGYYWRFTDDVNMSEPHGALLELPIYTQMVQTLKMLTGKRVSSQRKSFSTFQSNRQRLIRLLDFLRFWYPLKLDFCCMGIEELTSMMDRVIKEDQKNPTSYKPVVAIGHTKELYDFETVEAFLSYLERKGIAVSTFEDVYDRCVTVPGFNVQGS
ncbi:MAG: hypothetical protein LWX54_11685 [Deltaproteobacteria bacterium]|jgi:hypothetical protein|nr:hypothetical protein [Deltaproteobacteria bacterium]